MNNEFPKMLFRFPGSEPLQDGGYATHIVGSVDEEAEALEQGWFSTPAEARAAAEAATPTGNAESSRADLEAQAAKLGVRFSARTSDDKLTAAIDKARAEAQAKKAADGAVEARTKLLAEAAELGIENPEALDDTTLGEAVEAARAAG